jgi:tetratricopeptide (TPR) repeat protein
MFATLYRSDFYAMKQQLFFSLFLIVCLVDGMFAQSNQKLDQYIKEYKEFTGSDTTKLRLVHQILPLIKKTNSDETKSYIQDAIRLSAKINDPYLMAQTDYIAASTFASLGDQSQALTLLDRALPVFQKLKKDLNIANVYDRLGALYKEKKEHLKSKEYFEKAIEIYKKLGTKEDMISAYGNVASVYGLMGEVDKAIEMLDFAIKYCLEIDSKSLRARNLGSKARFLLQKGQTSQALACLFEALRVNEEQGDARSQLFNYQNIALVYLEINDFSKAMEYAQKGLKVNETVKNKRLEVGLSHVLCVVYSKQSRHKDAINCYEKTNEYFKEINDLVTVAENYAFLAGHLVEDRQYSNAFFAYKNLIDIYQTNNTANQIPNEMHRIGDLLLTMPDSSLRNISVRPEDRFSESLQYLENGLQLATKNDNLTHQKMLFAAISKNYEMQNKYAEAYDYYKKFISIRDSISGDEVQKKMLKSELNYEFEKKEIELLYQQKLTAERLENQLLITQKQKQFLKLSEQELLLSNQEKEMTKLAYLNEQAEKQEKAQMLEIAEEKQKIKDQEIVLQDLEISAKSTQNLYLSMLLGFLLLGFISLLIFYYALRKQKRIIAQQNQLNEHTIAILSHDIKEPLLGVQMLLRKLKKNEPYLAKASESLENQIAASNAVIFNLLKMKQLSFSENAGKNQKANVLNIIQATIKEQNLALTSKNIQVIANLDSNFYLPIAEEKLKIIVSNLLSNAIKYSFEGQEIRIYKDENGLCIQDYGVGLDASLKGKLLKELNVSQMGTLKEKGHGMGIFLLGLLLQNEDIQIIFDSPEIGGTIVKVFS